MFSAEILSRRQENVEKFQLWFLKRFRKEYLTIIRPNAVNVREIVTPKGDYIVQVHDEGPRQLWRLAMVIEFHDGKERHVRILNLRTRGGTVS